MATNTIKTYPQIQAIINKAFSTYAEKMRNLCLVESKPMPILNRNDFDDDWWWDSSYSTSYHHHHHHL
jgi:hypothetical protein